MATIITAKTFVGSPARQIITDLQTGRARPLSQPLVNSLLAWGVPALLGLVAGATWGRTSQPNEEILELKSSALEAEIDKRRATAEKLEAEARKLADAIDNKTGLSRETAEEIARRKIGLEERTADTIQARWREEIEFRELNAEGQRRLVDERVRGLEIETAIKDRQLTREFEKDILADERRELEANTLALQNLRVAQERALAASAITTQPLPEFRTPSPPPPIGIRAIGPGVPGAVRLTR